MARIRTIKPEFWTSEQVVECSPTARLLFIGIWTFADDGGVHPYTTRRLKMEVFPGDAMTDEQVGALVDELIRAKLLRVYEVDGERFLLVTGWKHQKIEKPTLRFPQPSEDTQFDDDSPSTRRTFDDHSPPEGNGVESKGKEETPCSPPRGTSGNRRKQTNSPANTEPELPTLPAKLDTPRMRQALGGWFEYKGKPPKPRALKALVTRLETRVVAHGEQAVVDAIETAMANEWKGWDFDRSFEGKTAQPVSKFVTPDEYAAMLASGEVDAIVNGRAQR